MPYWDNIKILLKPRNYGFTYQQKYDLYHRDHFFLKCKKTTIDGKNTHIWELENRHNHGKIKLKEEDMIKLFNLNPYLSKILQFH